MMMRDAAGAKLDAAVDEALAALDRKSTRLNSSHVLLAV
jgi:hypothetical protein